MTNYLFKFNIFGGAHNKNLNCVHVFLRKIPYRFRNNLTIGILNRKVIQFDSGIFYPDRNTL